MFILLQQPGDHLADPRVNRPSDDLAVGTEYDLPNVARDADRERPQGGVIHSTPRACPPCQSSWPSAKGSSEPVQQGKGDALAVDEVGQLYSSASHQVERPH